MEFPKLQNDNFLRAARGEKVDRVPVWLMRQAGRHLPEFKAFREKHDFLEICKDPKLCTEITLQPVNRYDLDAAIIFQDILTIPDAMGLELSMVKGVGPVFAKEFNLEQSYKNSQFDINITSICDKLSYVYNSLTHCRKELNGKIPLIGFSGAPFSLLGYMIEGKSSKTWAKTRATFYKYRDNFEEFINFMSNVIIEYCVRQIHGGAQLIQIFESNGMYISPEMVDICGSAIVKVVAGIKKQCPDSLVTVFCKDANNEMVALLSKCEFINVFSVDWSRTPKEARKIYSQNGIEFSLQGNLDPPILYSDPETVKDLTIKMVQEFGTSKYIANLGHGVYPDIPIKGVEAFIEAVHSVKID